VDLELLDKEGAKRLMAWDTVCPLPPLFPLTAFAPHLLLTADLLLFRLQNKDKVIQFAEFAAFFASEFLNNVLRFSASLSLPLPVSSPVLSLCYVCGRRRWTSTPKRPPPRL
jgi:hypothetical protein